MYIHLGLGWMHHPFALSSFRITSPEEIETIRALGLAQVRWEPDLSVPAPDAADPSGVTPASADPGAHAAAGPGAAATAPAAQPRAAGHGQPAPPACARRAALDAQRARQRLLERQYAEATAGLRDACRNLRAQPEQTRQDVETLSRALVDKLLVDGEMCIRLLSTAAGDRSTAHGMNVAVIALLVGRVFGLGEADMMDLGVGALLHDMGKVELPDRVRQFDEGFSGAEASLYRDHVKHGVVIARRMGLAPGAMAVIAQHHEHADGSGFPLRLSEARLTMGARIVALANRYDNLCNPVVPSRALTPHEALASLFAASRQRFDLGVLNAFIRMMGVYPAGSVVQLTDDRYALVVGVNSSRPLKPRVLVHDPRTPREDTLVLDLEQADGLGIRRSLGASKLPPAVREALSPRQRVSYFFEPLAGPIEEACA
jgi:putative nucleotidyltransferase with HDIG domain